MWNNDSLARDDVACASQGLPVTNTGDIRNVLVVTAEMESAQKGV